MTEDLHRKDYLENLINTVPSEEKHQLLNLDKSSGQINYVLNDIEHLKSRPFKSRLFVTFSSNDDYSVVLRTHHTDNAESASHFTNLRNYFQATINKNFFSARSELTTILAMYFNQEESAYYSSVCTWASAMSDHGKGFMFEGIDESNMDVKRQQMVLLMDVIFSKMKLENHLVKQGMANIFRVGYCMKERNFALALMLSLATFSLQLILVVYIAADTLTKWKHHPKFEDRFWYIPITLIATFFTAATALPSIKDAIEMNELLKENDIFKVFDLVSNVVLPIALLFAGAFLIFYADGYAEAVLNTSAELFIIEIDDILPRILNLNVIDIVHDYITHESIKEYNRRSKMEDAAVKKLVDTNDPRIPKINFHDILVTNTKEQPSSYENGSVYAPYEFIIHEKIKLGMKQEDKYVIATKKNINMDCLFTKIEWKYTSNNMRLTPFKRDISYLKLFKVNAKDPIEISLNGYSQMEDTHSVEGMFIITKFRMMDRITNLRICGSDNLDDFYKALDYYSLWSIDPTKKGVRQKMESNKKANTV